MDIYPTVKENIPQNDNKNTNFLSFIPSEEQQRVIAAAVNQDQKVLACSGSGKTTTLVFRLKFLLDLGISPSQILITTFNVHAIRNIAYLAKQILGIEQASQLEINNIDKFALKICKKYGFKQNNRNKQNCMIHQDQHQQQINQSSEMFFSVKECCSQFLEFLKTPKGKEFTDQQNYQYIFFDEFQDINEIQYEIIMLFKQRGAYLVVFGDVAQHIYGWRDSKIEIIQKRIDEDIKLITGETLKTFNLSMNFRSSKEIIQFGNQILKSSKEGFPIQKLMEWIEKQPQLELNVSLRNKSISSSFKNKLQQEYSNIYELFQFFQIKTACSKPKLLCFKDYQDQSEQIIKKILQLSDEYQLSFKDFAVICATNKPLQIFEETLEKNNSVNNLSQSISWVNLSDTNQNSYEFDFFSSNNYKNPSNQASPIQQCNKLTLSTIHKAKGLEWEVVFFIGLNDSNFPKSFLRESKQFAIESIEQECLRMFYVGCSRTISQLYFTVNTPTAFNSICRFFGNISEEYYERSDDIPFSAIQNCQTSRFYYQKDNVSKYFKSDLFLPDSGDIDRYERKIFHKRVSTIISQLDYLDYIEINDLLSSANINEQHPQLDLPMIIKDQDKLPHIITRKNEWVIKNEEQSKSQDFISSTSVSITIHLRSVFEYQALREANMIPGLELYIKLYCYYFNYYSYTMRRIAEEFDIANGFISQTARYLLFTVFWNPHDYQIIQEHKTFFEGYYFEFGNNVSSKNCMNNWSQEEGIKIAQSEKFKEFKTQFKEYQLKQYEKEKNMKANRKRHSHQRSIVNSSALKRIFLRLAEILQRRNTSFFQLNHLCRKSRKQEYLLPTDQDLTQILQSYERFQDSRISTKDITGDVFRVSQCCLFTERNNYPKQGLFRNQEDIVQLIESPNFIKNIDEFLRFIRSFNSQTIELKQLEISRKQQNEGFQDDSFWCLSASVDILVDKDTVYQIIPQQFKSISKEQILEVIQQTGRDSSIRDGNIILFLYVKVLAYISLKREEFEIKNIVFYNPIIGTIQAYDVSQWETKTIKNQPTLGSDSIDLNEQTNQNNNKEPSGFIDLLWRKAEKGFQQIQWKDDGNKQLSFIREKESKEINFIDINNQLTEESQMFNSTQDLRNDSRSLQQTQFESQQDPLSSQSTNDTLSQLSMTNQKTVKDGFGQQEKSLNLRSIIEFSKSNAPVLNYEEFSQNDKFNDHYQQELSITIQKDDPEIVKKRKITENRSNNLIKNQNKLDKQFIEEIEKPSTLAVK